jgi:hypothetical protein
MGLLVAISAGTLLSTTASSSQLVPTFALAVNVAVAVPVVDATGTASVVAAGIVGHPVLLPT